MQNIVNGSAKNDGPADANGEDDDEEREQNCGKEAAEEKPEERSVFQPRVRAYGRNHH